MIKHMKSEHTQSSSRTPNVTHDEIEIPRRIFVEDMSVCDISVDAVEDTNKEELLTEMKRCRKCMFEATDEDELETTEELLSEKIEAPSIENKDYLDDHIDLNQSPFKTPCESKMNEQNHNLMCSKCGKYFRTQTILSEHLEKNHIILRLYNCTSCDYGTTVQKELKMHIQSTHKSDNVFSFS